MLGDVAREDRTGVLGIAQVRRDEVFALRATEETVIFRAEGPSTIYPLKERSNTTAEKSPACICGARHAEGKRYDPGRALAL